MRTDTIARQIERPCSFDHFLNVLGHPPSLASPQIPRSLRDHIGAREFGDFGTVLMAERPASADLSDRVARWRKIERDIHGDLPLFAYPERAAEDRLFNWLFIATPVAIMLWVVITLIAAWARGVL